MEINEDFVCLDKYKKKEEDLFSLLDAGIKKQVSIYAFANTSELIVLSPAQIILIKSAYPDSVKTELKHDVRTTLVTTKDVSHWYEYSGTDLWITKQDTDSIFHKPSTTSAGVETERSSMLKMLLGMAMAAYDYNPDADKNRATGSNKGSIKYDLEKYGLIISQDTVRKYLKEAAQTHMWKVRQSATEK